MIWKRPGQEFLLCGLSTARLLGITTRLLLLYATVEIIIKPFGLSYDAALFY